MYIVFLNKYSYKLTETQVLSHHSNVIDVCGSGENQEKSGIHKLRVLLQAM